MDCSVVQSSIEALKTPSAMWRLNSATVAAVVLVTGTAALPLLPFVDSYILSIVVRALLFIALGQAWNVVAGIGGQLSLGHGVFFGLGAYATALLFNYWQVNPWLGVAIGIAISVTVALLMGAVTLRLRGVYFALATVVISLGFEKLARHYSELTGGEAGLAVRFLGDSWGVMQSRGPALFVWLTLSVVLCYWLLTRRLLRSRFGLELQAVRDDEDAAAASGVPVLRTKLAGLSLSAAMTALVGTLHVQFYLTIDPGAAFGLFQAIQIQLPSLIGGLGTAGGPVVGGAVMVLASELTNWAATKVGIEGIDVLAYGLILLVVVIGAPTGILGWLQGRSKRGLG